MNENLCRAYLAAVDDVIPAERQIVAKINTGAVDHYKTVIDPMGIDLSVYRQNPVVLWEHGKDPTRGRLPVGKNVGIAATKLKNGSIVARTQFAKDDYSQSLFEAYRDGLLRGWSVNVLPDDNKSSPPTKDEKRARPELNDCLMMYRGGTLTEYSAVAVPGNPETLSILEQRGIWIPDEARAAVQPDEPEDDSEDSDEDNEDSDEESGEADEQAEDAAEQAKRSMTVVDMGAIHRHYLTMIDTHFRTMRDDIRAQLDLMRGKV